MTARRQVVLQVKQRFEVFVAALERGQHLGIVDRDPLTYCTDSADEDCPVLSPRDEERVVRRNSQVSDG